MWLGVVVQQVAPQPEIGLRLGLGLVEMVEGLVRFLHGAEGAFTLPFDRAVGRRPSFPVGRWVADPHAEMLHHAMEDPALRDRTVVEVEGLGDALEGKALLGFGRHGVEQEAQRRLDVFAVDAAIFLVADAAAVIDDAVEHERRRATAGLHPGRCLDLLQVGGEGRIARRRCLGLQAGPAAGGRLIRSWS